MNKYNMNLIQINNQSVL